MDGHKIENYTGLSLEDKVARLCVVGVPGRTVGAETVQRFARRPFGGIGVFPHNIATEEQLTSWLEEVKAAAANNRYAAAPFYVSIDEEAGILSNLKGFYPYLPGNRAVGLTDDPAAAGELGRLIGSQLHNLGIPMSWAPVLDVNRNMENPVVGVRSFGESPERVAELGAAYIAGLHEAGIAATAKHFPGHGEVTGDSHYMLPACPLTLEQVMAGPILPFRRAIEAGADAIMTAHIVYPQIPQAAGLPASLCPFFVTELLRVRLGFTGVICTDDVEMGAIKDRFPPRQIGELAILAGNDLILMCHTPGFQDEVMAGIVEAVRAGRIAESRIDESLDRLALLRRKMEAYRAAARPLPRGEWEQRADQLARKTIVVRDDAAGLLPLSMSNRYLLLLPKPERLTQADNSDQAELILAGVLAERGHRVESLPISLDPDETELAVVLAAAGACDVVIQGTLNAHMYPGQTELAHRLIERKPLLHLILRNPYDVDCLPAESSKVLICSTADHSLMAFAGLYS